MVGTIRRETLDETLDAIVEHGVHHLQYHVPTGPSLAEVREAMNARQITISALSGTYNMIDPDVEKRHAGLRMLRSVAEQCAPMGTSVITICTGSRNPDSMWRAHPDNNSASAWRDLVTSMRQALEVAEEYEVTLAFEPEVANVIDSAPRARRFLDEMQSPYLKVCMDGANVFHKGELPKMREILDEAFELLGDDIALAHAKDLDRDGQAGHLAAGTGLLDYDQYLGLLKESGYDGAVVLHGLSEEQVPFCTGFLREKIDAL
jgi:sugar phosphate isomerase/epimerase